MENKSSKTRNNNLPKKTKAPRNGKIDLLKFVFSIVVAIYHFGNSKEYPEKLFCRGYFAVEFFFIVSGYLFAKSLSKYDRRENISILNESLKFMKKKYLSFLPPHFLIYIATLICLINYCQLTLEQLLVKIFNSIPDLLLLQMFDAVPLQWFGHEWYLSAMIIVMFVMTPIMIKFRRQYSRYAAPIISLSILTYLSQKHGNLNVVRVWDGIAYSGLLRAFADMSIGCICYAVAESGVVERMKREVLMILEILCYYFVFLYMNSIYTTTIEFSLIYLLAFGITISFSTKASINALNNRFVYFLGKLSLPIYLCHIAVRGFVVSVPWEDGYWSFLGIFLLITLGISLLFMFLVDGINYLLKMKKERPIKKTEV